MAEIETLDLLVEGGKAKPGPATAPKLGELKVNIGKLFQDINEMTKEYANMNVPVKVIVNKKDKSYTIKIGTPPVSSLLRKELGLKKIAPEKKEEASEETTEKTDKKASKSPSASSGTTKTPEKKEKKGKSERQIIANIKMEQCVKIARMKRASLLSKTFKSAVKEIVGSCVSMPVTVDGKSPKEVLKEINQGKYDELLKE